MTRRAEPRTATLVRGSISRRPIGAVIKVEGARARPPFLVLKEGTCVVGSGSNADLVIADTTISRRHASLEILPAGVLVTDLGSRNGLFYLGQRVEKITLALGSRLRVGSATLLLHADTEGLTGVATAEDTFRGMIGASVAMRTVFATMARLEGSLVPVLVLGESGVGKELVAKAVHEGSRAAGAPLVILNCAAIPRDLVVSELFGHRRGAFTGAIESRPGAFGEADGGTLFLDEVGELPLDVQPALLRALETGEIRGVGEEGVRRVNVRVIAATNRDLGAEVQARRFREDLYFRLAVVKMTVPPLRDRPEDIGPLARSFALAAGAPDLPDDVIAHLTAQDWPGNVRELRNAVLAWIAMGELPAERSANRSLLDGALADLVDLSRPYAEQKEDVLDRFTKVYLQALMVRAEYNQSKAARIAGVDRSHLGKMLARYGLSRGT